MALEKKKALEDVGNANNFKETTIVGEDNSIITAPEVEINQKKISGICAIPVYDRNEGEREVTVKQLEVSMKQKGCLYVATK